MHFPLYVCVPGSPCLVCRAGTYHITYGDVWNSLSAPWDSPSVLECIYSAGLIWTEVLYSSPASVLLSLLSQTCSVPRPSPSTHSQGHPDLRSKRPTVAMGTISPLSALLRSAWSEAICPLPILHPSYPSTPSSFFSPFGKKNPPFSRGMTIPSPILSLRFIHPQCLAPATSSPPTLTPTLYSLYKCVCVAPSTDWERVEGGKWRGNEGRICICCWFQPHRMS